MLYNNNSYNSPYIFGLVIYQRASLKLEDLSDFRRFIIFWIMLIFILKVVYIVIRLMKIAILRICFNKVINWRRFLIELCTWIVWLELIASNNSSATTSVFRLWMACGNTKNSSAQRLFYIRLSIVHFVYFYLLRASNCKLRWVIFLYWRRVMTHYKASCLPAGILYEWTQIGGGF
jgi:hypothetical protein